MTCPGRHKLQEQTVSTDGASCDGCRCRILRGDVVRGCRECNYDLCMKCVRGVHRQADGAGDDKEAATRAEFKALFRQMAGSDRVLDQREMLKLVQLLAAKLRVPTFVFGECGLMFYRYDFSGTGKLNENEGLMLIEGMYRAAKDAKDPKAARAGMMNSRDIPVKTLESSYKVTKKLGQGG